eukprot:TRINITY_DN38985_c0_g1_i2.p1 TRINITY_DN38985_c0_g1~~TRINITY_DN38985_c0_g1_i2.p1  ORF type:complete len:322 (+),score=70.97 TRINITY_DN38985_c0_g1_i2:2-967(+)
MLIHYLSALYSFFCLQSFLFFSFCLHSSYVFLFFFFFLMIRRPPRSTLSSSSAASDVYKRQRKRKADYDQVKLPGEPIGCETGFLRGHGTYINNSQLTASVCGVLQEVNKLKAVQPLKSRYVGEVGDVVVGKVIEVGQKRWKLDVNSHQDGILMLSAVNLPGNVQRRRTAEDQLQMRSFFVEDDAVCMEVQQINQDGSISLHTRSERYGKLGEGLFLKVHAALVKRSAQHFHSLDCGVDAILGNNGYIWLSGSTDQGDEPQDPARMLEQIARVRNAIVLLEQEFMMISVQSIMQVLSASIQAGLHPKEMLGDWLPSCLRIN